MYIIRKHYCPRKQQILSIQVDGIYFQPGKSAAPKIAEEVERTTYGSLHALTRPIPRNEQKVVLQKDQEYLGQKKDWQETIGQSDSAKRVYKINSLDREEHCEKVRPFMGGELALSVPNYRPWNGQPTWRSWGKTSSWRSSDPM